MPRPIILYPAASLFCGRENLFNINLVYRLESMRNPSHSQKYQARLPQRDGFEFGNLASSLANKLPSQEVDLAVKNVIYLLDLGIFLPQSDVVVANFDEPLDPGVDIEINHAREMHKFVLGIRTDVRSPYGNSGDALGGMHFFPAYQCDVMIREYMPCKDIDSAKKEMDKLASKVDEEIDRSIISQRKKRAITSSHIKRTIRAANILFEGIEDIHSTAGLEKIARRYADNKRLFDSFAPRVTS